MQKDAHSQPQVGDQPGVQVADFGDARLGKFAPGVDLLFLDVDQHPLDDVADLFHVDGEADDVGPAPAFFFVERLARHLGQVVLDVGIELVDRVVELAQFLRQLAVAVADHLQRPGEHGLDHVGLVHGLAHRAGNRQRGRRQRRRIQVALAPGHGAALGYGQHQRGPVRDELRQPDEGQRDQQVDAQMKQHHQRCQVI